MEEILYERERESSDLVLLKIRFYCILGGRLCVLVSRLAHELYKKEMDATRVTMLNCVGFRDNYLLDYSLLVCYQRI